MASDTYHEPLEKLSPATIDLHRAVRSLMEELEAIDWYQQRVDATDDQELRAVLAHNRDEEVEHAMMTLEWIRRRHSTFDAAMRTFLFSEGDITTVEARTKAQAGDQGGGREAGAGGNSKGSVTIGSLRGAQR